MAWAIFYDYRLYVNGLINMYRFYIIEKLKAITFPLSLVSRASRIVLVIPRSPVCQVVFMSILTLIELYEVYAMMGLALQKRRLYRRACEMHTNNQGTPAERGHAFTDFVHTETLFKAYCLTLNPIVLILCWLCVGIPYVPYAIPIIFNSRRIVYNILAVLSGAYHRAAPVLEAVPFVPHGILYPPNDKQLMEDMRRTYQVPRSDTPPVTKCFNFPPKPSSPKPTSSAVESESEESEEELLVPSRPSAKEKERIEEGKGKQNTQRSYVYRGGNDRRGNKRQRRTYKQYDPDIDKRPDLDDTRYDDEPGYSRDDYPDEPEVPPPLRDLSPDSRAMAFRSEEPGLWGDDIPFEALMRRCGFVRRESIQGSVAVHPPDPAKVGRVSLYELAEKVERLSARVEQLLTSKAPLHEAPKACKPNPPDKKIKHVKLEAIKDGNPLMPKFQTVLCLASDKTPICEAIPLVGGLVTTLHAAAEIEYFSYKDVTFKRPPTCTPVKLAPDVAYFALTIPNCPYIKIGKIKEPTLGEKIGIFSNVNQQFSIGTVTSVSQDGIGYDGLSTKVGHCGAPVVTPNGFVVGMHNRDSGGLYLHTLLQFFRNPSMSYVTAKSTASTSCTNAEECCTTTTPERPPSPAKGADRGKAVAAK